MSDNRASLLYPDNNNGPSVTRVATADTDKPDRAGQLYGSNDPADKEPAAVELLPDESPVDDLNAEYPAGSPYSLERGSIEDDMYGGESRIELSSETDLSLIGESLEADDEELAVLERNLGFIAHSSGASQNDMSGLVRSATEFLVSPEPVDQKVVMADLYSEFGSDLPGRLADAQALVQSFPDLSVWLEQTGAGNSPKIIRAVMRLTETPRSQDRLAQLKRLEG